MRSILGRNPGTVQRALGSAICPIGLAMGCALGTQPASLTMLAPTSFPPLAALRSTA